MKRSGEEAKEGEGEGGKMRQVMVDGKNKGNKEKMWSREKEEKKTGKQKRRERKEEKE